MAVEPRVCPTWRARMIDRIAQVDTPHRTAAAFAIGVFLSFSPLLGLQVLVGLSTAVLLRLSRAAVFAGLCTNLPWIMVPWYTLTTALAAPVLGTPLGADLSTSLSGLFNVPIYQMAFWQQAAEVLAPFFWSFVVGTTIGAAVVGVVAYVMTARVVARIQSLQAGQVPADLVTD